MRSWTFWDWTGYASLWLAAVFMALAEGLKKMPGAPGEGDPRWLAFLPLGLLLLATAVLAVRAWRRPKSQDAPEFAGWPEPYSPSVVHGKRFINQEVLLDGHRYTNCIFENCTFKYNGTTEVQFENNRIFGRPMYSTDNPAIRGTWVLAIGTGLFREDTELVGRGAFAAREPPAPSAWPEPPPPRGRR